MAQQLGTVPQKHKHSEVFCHNNRHYGYIEAGLKLFSDSLAKHCPPFLTSKHFAVTSTFPTALTWAFGCHIRPLSSQICSKILQEWILTHIHLCWENQLSSLCLIWKRKTSISGWLKWEQKYWGQMTPPPLEAPKALWYCHKTWHQQPGESTGSPKTRMPKRAPGHSISQWFWDVGQETTLLGPAQGYPDRAGG